jgi:hypothetical protein
MKLISKNHKMEKLFYKNATWISHTNKYRLDLFENDNSNLLNASTLKVMPNYPPKDWFKNPKAKLNKVLKIVMVGALSVEDLYLTEITSWVEKQHGKVILDLYCILVKQDAIVFFKENKFKYVNLLDGVSYYDLKSILPLYHVGVILYKGKTLNYIYNAPNKLFEYLICGLDVWFPKEMIGCFEYVSNLSPKVIKVDFNKIVDYVDYKNSINNVNSIHQFSYCCELEYQKLINSFLN